MNIGRPKWWTEEDDRAVDKFLQLESEEWLPPCEEGRDAIEWCESPEFKSGMFLLTEFVDLHSCVWTCRRCLHWKSEDGETGLCPINDVETVKTSTCEEFEVEHEKGA